MGIYFWAVYSILLIYWLVFSSIPYYLSFLKKIFKVGLFIYLFIFDCAGSLLLHTGFLWSQYAGFSLLWLLLWQNTASRGMGFGSCGIWAKQLQLMGSRALAQQLWYTGLVATQLWGLPRVEIQFVSPALIGEFLATGPPGKPSCRLDCCSFIVNLKVKQHQSSNFFLCKYCVGYKSYPLSINSRISLLITIK